VVTTLNFAKGHGTRNDFVIVLDREGILPVGPDVVRFLCDRRAGIGGDGLLRAVRASHMPEWSGRPDVWFMDYRNADGSLAEMCGNGLRVFVRFLLEEGLVDQTPIQIATRAGLMEAWPLDGGLIRISLGHAEVAETPTWVRHAGIEYPATTVDVGNPHAVVELADLDALRALDLGVAPIFDPQIYPQGVNVEFYVARGDRDLQMRVHERGVGETESCGTGIVAVAAAQAAHAGFRGGVDVHVPGGDLRVDLAEDGVFLTGPAVVVAHGTVVLP